MSKRTIKNVLRPGDPGYIAARTGQTGGQRGCLCPDIPTYSRECCNGSIWAQGIGSITRTI
jgi:hypothetical protein